MPLQKVVSKELTQLEQKTKAELITLILGDETVIDAETVEALNGDIAELKETIRSALNGEVVGHRLIKWSYYKTGEVDKILLKNYNSKEICILDECIQHFRDGRQPKRFSNIEKSRTEI